MYFDTRSIKTDCHRGDVIVGRNHSGVLGYLKQIRVSAAKKNAVTIWDPSVRLKLPQNISISVCYDSECAPHMCHSLSYARKLQALGMIE